VSTRWLSTRSKYACLTFRRRLGVWEQQACRV
jgi:hypothetical protein